MSTIAIAAVVAAAAVAGGGWWAYTEGKSAGAAEMAATFASAQEIAIAARDAEQARRVEAAQAGARKFEEDRRAIQARLRATDERLAAALAAVECDVPPDALRGVRRAAGELEPDPAAEGAHAGKP